MDYRFLKRLTIFAKSVGIRQSMTTSSKLGKDHYKLLIVGGGTAGLSCTHKFADIVQRGQMAIVEPKNIHYYQPGWTLVGAGMIDLSKTVKPLGNLIHKNCTWIQDTVEEFCPVENKILTRNGDEICYDFAIIAVGLRQRFEWIKGLREALDSEEKNGVCSNYSPIYVRKTYGAMEDFSRGGNAIFTCPAATLNCPAAPMKICYLAEDFFRKRKTPTTRTRIMYRTGLPRLFPVDKYETTLLRLMNERDIELKIGADLIEVEPDRKEAVFSLVDPKTNRLLGHETCQYEMLHVAPPCSPIDQLLEMAKINKNKNNAKSHQFVDSNGYVNIDCESLQHIHYENVFALGDCAATDSAKSAASISSQLAVLGINLRAVMDGREPNAKFDGYTSCPILTGYRRGIIAEFDRHKTVTESIPFVDQSREGYLFYLIKRYLLPFVYWRLLLKGRWEGPKNIWTGIFRFKRKNWLKIFF